MRIAIIGQVRFPAERMADVRAAIAPLTAATRAEPGCVLYAFAEDLGDPGLLRVSEIWESRAALNAHVQTAHVATWRAAGPALGVAERELRIFTVAEEETL